MDCPRFSRGVGDGRVVRQDMLAVLGQPEVDFGPFEKIVDAMLQRRAGVFWRLTRLTAMSNELNCSRRLERLEEWEFPRTASPGGH